MNISDPDNDYVGQNVFRVFYFNFTLFYVVPIVISTVLYCLIIRIIHQREISLREVAEVVASRGDTVGVMDPLTSNQPEDTACVESVNVREVATNRVTRVATSANIPSTDDRKKTLDLLRKVTKTNAKLSKNKLTS